MALTADTPSSTDEIIRNVPCTCVDGRTQGARHSCAGGSLGLLVEILNGFEQHQQKALKPAEVERMMRAVAEQVAPLYLHTDQHAVDAILARLSLPTHQVLSALNDTQQRAFIE